MQQLEVSWSEGQGLSETNSSESIATWSYVGEGEVLTESSDILYHGSIDWSDS